MIVPKALLAALGLSLISSIQSTTGHPISSGIDTGDLDHVLIDKRADPADFYLRVMPLGASITRGDVPAGGVKEMENGYRKYLRDKLRSEGWKVNMVGNFNRGDMRDNDHEGVGGEHVNKVEVRARGSVKHWLPNVILINAGTNDAQSDSKEYVDATGIRMKQLIDTIFGLVPSAVVVLSTLLPNNNAKNGTPVQVNVDNVNGQYRNVWREYQNSGRKVMLADMAGYVTPQDIMGDGIHPTVGGNRKMAAVWDWAVNEAHQKGWISAPPHSDSFDDGKTSKTCKKEFGSGAKDPHSGNMVLYAGQPNIRTDGPYVHKTQERTDRAKTIRNLQDMNKDTTIWFGQLHRIEQNNYKGDERDELIVANNGRDNRKFWMYKNNGDAQFNEAPVEIDIKQDLQRCTNANIHWGDVNGDGLDDCICVRANGDMYVSINLGSSSGKPEFKDVGLYKVQVGHGAQNVRLGDIDGDGRLDYCIIDNKEDVYCWRNGGTGEKAAYWEELNPAPGQPTFLSQGKGDIKGMRFVDINADGGYDWMWMDTSGRATTFINYRGSGMRTKPEWNNVGVTHGGMGSHIGDDREFIRFGRLTTGRASYIKWEKKDCPSNGDNSASCHIELKIWENLGSGGMFQKGDGIYWGDMTGTGVDDYLWINSQGEVNIFLNKNTNTSTDHYATNPWGNPIVERLNTDRNRLHIGDWDGDGKADIIEVVDRNTGAIKVWRNRWSPGQNTFNFEAQDIPGSAGRCTQGWGIGYKDKGPRFADVTGSGKVDYLCLTPNGTITAWLRNRDRDIDAGQVKFTEGLDRANLQFSDINGDGHADLIHTDRYNGDATVWYFNKVLEESERDANAGSLIRWDRPEKLFQGATRGINEYFPSLSGQGRGDLVYADATSGEARISFNLCPTGGDDEDSKLPDGTVRDPGLPGYNPPQVV